MSATATGRYGEVVSTSGGFAGRAIGWDNLALVSFRDDMMLWPIRPPNELHPDIGALPEDEDLAYVAATYPDALKRPHP